MTNKYDFSDRTSYNGIPCNEDEVLVPVVLDENMKEQLMLDGFKDSNAETWKVGINNKLVPVAYVPWSKNLLDDAIKDFNQQVNKYINRFKTDENILSLDKMQEDSQKEGKTGYDPTGTRELDESLIYEIKLTRLIDKVLKLDSKKALCIRLLAEGYSKGEILQILDLNVKKTQGYELIKKCQEIAKELIEEGL